MLSGGAVEQVFMDKGEIISVARGETPEELPEELIIAELDNTWHDTGEAIINHWIGHVYQITNIDRTRPFKDIIDPDNPLGCY